MASREPETAPAPRLYLVTPPVDDAGAFAPTLSAALEAADVAAVLLRLPEGDERSLINRVKTLAGVVQSRDIALILDGHPEIAARAGADGAHLTGIAAFTEALEALKPARIAGAGRVTTRHDAMLAAEAGADYVMFGDVDEDGQRPPLTAIEERVSWWAEVFQPPCVAYAAAMDEIAPLVRAGADFIAVGEWVWTDPRGAAAAVAEAVRHLAREPAA